MRIGNIGLLLLLQYAIYFNFYAESIHFSRANLIIGLTSLTAIFGNLINDYFDIANDTYNNRKNPLIGNEKLQQELLRVLYGLGLLIHVGILLVFMTQVMLALAILSSFWVLFFYAYPHFLWLKSTVLVGNLTIAFLSALSLSIFFFDKFLLPDGVLFWVILSFLGTFSREMSKDVEDMAGDKKANVCTLATRFGVKKSKRIVFFTLFILAIFVLNHIENAFSYYNGLKIGVLLAILMLLYVTSQAQNQQDWKKISRLHKIMMGFAFVGIFMAK